MLPVKHGIRGGSNASRCVDTALTAGHAWPPCVKFSHAQQTWRDETAEERGAQMSGSRRDVWADTCAVSTSPKLPRAWSFG